jgi:hypothetical protein
VAGASGPDGAYVFKRSHRERALRWEESSARSARDLLVASLFRFFLPPGRKQGYDQGRAKPAALHLFRRRPEAIEKPVGREIGARFLELMVRHSTIRRAFRAASIPSSLRLP